MYYLYFTKFFRKVFFETIRISEIVVKMTSYSTKQFCRENLILFLDFGNENDDSDEEFETQDLYD